MKMLRYSTARVSKRGACRANRLLTRAVLYRFLVSDEYYPPGGIEKLPNDTAQLAARSFMERKMS